jgi:hypothetical protein
MLRFVKLGLSPDVTPELLAAEPKSPLGALEGKTLMVQARERASPTTVHCSVGSGGAQVRSRHRTERSVMTMSCVAVLFSVLRSMASIVFMSVVIFVHPFRQWDTLQPIRQV